MIGPPSRAFVRLGKLAYLHIHQRGFQSNHPLTEPPEGVEKIRQVAITRGTELTFFPNFYFSLFLKNSIHFLHAKHNFV